MKKIFIYVSMILLLVLSACSGLASKETTEVPTMLPSNSDIVFPPEITGEVIYVPFPVKITIDGDLLDWDKIPQIKVEKGSVISTNPEEDGSFSFQVAADKTNFYIAMRAVDKNIIAGKHGTNFWNEDSLEFFLNASGDLNTRTYKPKIFQLNINSADIGNTDPNLLTVTGVQSSDIKVTGFVFSTENGWGFEASLPLQDLVTPEHGLEIGFQAQMNGASTLDRDVKLIWSNEDTTDQSWQIPALFGRAIFFELGRTDIPQPSVREAMVMPTATPGPVAIPALISVNQVGYFPDGEKIALLAIDSTEPQDWVMVNQNQEEIIKGKTSIKGKDVNSGDFLHIIDFSTVTAPGEGYVIKTGSLASVPFRISADLYSSLKRDALSYFYLNRSGIVIDPQYSGQEWARPAGHLSDRNVTCFKGIDSTGTTWPGCGYSLNVAGGWYDAGDFGKYVVNGGITAWTLMNLFEQFPSEYPDNVQSLPEKGNGIPDILDESRWEMEFLLSMQVPDGQPMAGMVHHKIHDETWAPMPMVPPTEVGIDNKDGKTVNGRYLFPPSTAATLNLAATSAQCARIWQNIDSIFSARCLVAAEKAWKAGLANPAVYAGNVPGSGGGNYEDNNVSDEFYWAASELYITTGKQEYLNYLVKSDQFGKVSSFDWGNTTSLGTISLAMVKNGLATDKLDVLKKNILSYADEMIILQNADGYFVPIKGDYPWGSNGTILNNLILMSDAFKLTGDQNYLNSVKLGMDYILGRNSINKSFVSGYGTYPMQHPHHRFWANDISNGYPLPPPGALSGGPNFNPSDDAAINANLQDLPPAKRYLDELESFSTNEVAINWNAPLVWVTAFLDQTENQ